MTANLCDTCRAAGSCCVEFNVSGGGLSSSFWADDTTWREQYNRQLADHGFPYLTATRLKNITKDENGREYGIPTATCSRLEGGRCRDYENRPDFCRRYEPGSDKLCAEYKTCEEE